MLVVLVFVLGALGGIGIKASESLEEGLLKDLGSFVGTLGELVDLTITIIAAIGGAFWLGSVGSTLAASALRHVYGLPSHILGAILGLLSGAILLASVAYVGTQAALFTLLTPIVAAVIGGQLALLLVEHIGLLARSVGRIQADQSDTERVIRTVIFWIGAIVTFVVVALFMDLMRAIVDQRLPSQLTTDLGLFDVQTYVANAALVGAVLGGAAGGLSGTQTPFPLGMTLYNTARTILNTLRSIEPLIMGIVFVIWVGVGPFAGVLALTLHSVAALGKLYSEQVENIDAGPIEAIQSTGANRLQTIVYAVVPQIVPPYIAFTMYRWDINVRMSTIIGFVGGGGIGFLLQQQINLLRYRQAGVAVLAIAIVVSVLDYASAAIRERIV
ncbi:MAG: ABC transporter permease subunit [Anaerolineae bacterium]|nr:ABC transporter permease subunit [Anaerolineae bacterium]